MKSCAMVVLAAAQALVLHTAEAQQSESSTETRQPGLWIEPRISLQHTVTNNARLDATHMSDQVTEVSPGLRVVSNTAHIKGFFDYSLSGIHYARGAGFDHVRHNLNANAVIEAIEQRAFIDLAGVVASQPISAFGAPVGGSPANANAAQSSSFRISPYLRGSFGSVADYEARYSVQGVESTNQLSLARKSSSIVGVGVVWQPSERTRLSLDRERRYFGSAYNVALEHRTGRTVWRYTDSKGISTGQNAQSASLGSLFDLLNGVYARQEADPVRRTQLVLAEIERLGLPANLQVFPDFLRSSNTLQRMQQLSLALLGQRSMVTFAATRSDNQRLDTIARSLGDDFDTNSRIRQRGWSLWLAHRLTPNSSIDANWLELQSTGTVPGLETRVRSLSFGLTTLLAPRTSGGLQVRRIVSDGLASPYSESAVVGTITHRF